MTKANSYYRSIRESREEWRDSQPQVCMSCGKRGHLEVHEIERRSQAPLRWAHPCNYLLLCHTCHAGQFAAMEHAQQLALKYTADREHFSLEKWLMLKDPELRAPYRVTTEDIEEFLPHCGKTI